MPITTDLGKETRRRLGSLLLPPPTKPSLSERKQEEEQTKKKEEKEKKKKKVGGFPSMGAFRGLGCTTSTSSTSSAHVLSPTPAAAAATVRASAEWPSKKRHGRKKKQRKKETRTSGDHHHHLLQSNCITVNPSDVWCAIDSSVDCVPPHFHHHRHRSDRPPPPSREDDEGEYVGRVVGGGGGGGGGGEEEEDVLRVSSLLEDEDMQSPQEVPLLGNDARCSRNVHRSRRIRRSPGGLDELTMFQARIFLGEMDIHDRYRDLRLDVDGMSYEELLELGDRIGHVSTGLREEEILRCLRKMKHSKFNASTMQCSSELERKCSICQEEYELNEEVGKLDCGHGYHPSCIKQWLLRKNACPVCKAAVARR